MIYDHLGNHAYYRSLHPWIARAFDYLADFDPGTPDGKVVLEGEDLFAVVQSYETRVPADKKMESHRRYVDLQYIVSGEETLYHCPTGRLILKVAYNEERDVQFYEHMDEQALILKPGDFTILFQHDGHKPGCIHGTAQTVRKIVFKIRF